MKTIVFIAFLAAFVSGCAVTPMPTPLQIALKDCGPAPVDYKEQIEALIGFRLKDPESARYKYSIPEKGCVRSAPLQGSKLYFGWLVNVEVNAKNSYGGYTGYELYQTLFQDGEIVAWSKPPHDLYSVWIFAKDAKNDPEKKPAKIASTSRSQLQSPRSR